jgi:hypothetical protein
MGVQVVVMFIDSFMDDIAYVRVVTYQGAFAMAVRILDWDLCVMTVGLAGETPQFYSLAPYGFDYRFVDE